MTNDDLEKQAVQAAIKGTWQKAIQLNRQIIKEDSKNIGALNRLARAYWELGKVDEAQKSYRQVLKLDPYNSIATKNLQRLVKKRKKGKQKKISLSGNLFLEEPGKTKTIKLIRLASAEVLSELNSGQSVKLEPKKRTISVISEDKVYLGTVPDDLSLRLIKLINGGNRYQAFIKGVDRQHLDIFVREVFRSKRFHNLPSFSPSGSTYISYLSPETIHEERPETAPTGEEEEVKK
jgi:tetratricopeptide (TPR) repeat protein